MRSADGGSEPTTGTCGVTNPFRGDKLFPDFCPPRADLARAGSPAHRLSGDDVPHMDMCDMTPIGRSSSKFADDIVQQTHFYYFIGFRCSGCIRNIVGGGHGDLKKKDGGRCGGGGSDDCWVHFPITCVIQVEHGINWK